MLSCFAGILFFSGKKGNKPEITFQSLLREMADRMATAHWPLIEYRSLQASSYNRESVSPDKPGWFADSDGISWIREEIINGKKEYVIMEHQGPGCITRMWTPFFYYGFDKRKGPNIRIYLDGSKKPVIDENFIALLTGKGSIRPPFTGYTALAGVCFLPIPFAKSCRITLDDKAFYNIINYRAYSEGTTVQSFSEKIYNNSRAVLDETARKLTSHEIIPGGWEKIETASIEPKDSMVIDLPGGNQAIQQLTIKFDPLADTKSLRSTILSIVFDGKQTIWCPAGDFFCSGDTLNEFSTRNLSVSGDGTMTCSWVMPYSSSARLSLMNFSDTEIRLTVGVNVLKHEWNGRSMYFHTNWAPVGTLPGNLFFDLNFIDVRGKGVLAGDALTVLSPGKGWWGEGDEKIYIDETDIKSGFPSHFGTGTEDYYGWAGGVVPTGEDVFSRPFGSNVRNGNKKDPRGYNICMRNRILDAIPFKERLVFDMEASPGTDIRNYWNLLDYSLVTWWYGMAGAESNRKPVKDSNKMRLRSLGELEWLQQMLKAGTVSFNPENLVKHVKGN